MTYAYVAKQPHGPCAVGGQWGSLLQDTDQYSVSNNLWINLTDMPDPTRASLAVSAIENIAYAFSGYTPWPVQFYTDCDELDSNTWTSKTDMSLGRRALTASTISSKCYVYNGYYESGGSPYYSRSCDEYDPDSWTNKTDTPTPGRYAGAASTISSKGYIYCGATSTAFLQDCDEYNPDSWANKTSAPTPARRFLAAATIGPSGYIVGGKNASGLFQDCDAYSASGDSWTNKTDMPAPTRYRCAAASVGSVVLYVYGGRGPSEWSGPLADCDQFVGVLDSWSSVADMPVPSREHLAGCTIW